MPPLGAAYQHFARRPRPCACICCPKFPEWKATNDIAEEKLVQHACLALFPVTEFRSDLQKWRKKATSHLNVPIPFRVSRCTYHLHIYFMNEQTTSASDHGVSAAQRLITPRINYSAFLSVSTLPLKLNVAVDVELSDYAPSS